MLHLVLPVSGGQYEGVEGVEEHGKVLVLILSDLQLQLLTEMEERNYFIKPGIYSV